ncbi:MAG: tetratricopeptide repeat protein, partial [Candidatus Krumholzibacteria bacterium]|nr:tetratricopeptide repeat protein [Candidatus Krumholzibacteria bacterium]
KRVETRLVTVTLSNTTRVVPVEFRYLGTIISEALEDPKALGQSPPVKLSIVVEAERALFEERILAADSIYRVPVETNPLEPGFHYSLAMTSGLLRNAEDCTVRLDEAYRLDPVYAQGLFQIANMLAASGKLSTAEELVKRSAARDALTDSELGYGTGVMYVMAAAPDRALPFLQNAARFNQEDFWLQNLIYKTSRDAGDAQGMIGALEKLFEIDPETVNQLMPWVYRELGVLYEKHGDKQRAGRMYRQYLEIVPSDSTAVELRAKIQELLRM